MDTLVFRGPGKISQAVLGGSDVNFERPDDFLSVELLHPVVAMTGVGRYAVRFSFRGLQQLVRLYAT